jgi:hypothetical protein
VAPVEQPRVPTVIAGKAAGPRQLHGLLEKLGFGRT